MRGTDYANRDIEYEEIRHYLFDEGAKGIIIKAHPASGVTSFAKSRIIDNLLPEKSVLYLNMTRETSLSEALFSQLVRPPYVDIFQKYIDKYLGEHDDSILSAMVQCAPYIGPFLGRVFTTRAAQPIYIGDYPSAVEALLLPFFIKYSKIINTTITVIVDRAQYLTEDSFELLNDLIGSNNIRCILIVTDKQAALKLINYMNFHDIMCKEVEFDQPQIKLIKELAKLYGYTISSEDSEHIARDTQHNIHSIINAVSNFGKQTIDIPLSAWERAIISILQIYGIPMNVTKLAAVMQAGPSFAPDPETSCRETLQQLIKRRLIVMHGDAFFLDSPAHPLVREVLEHKAEQLVYVNMVYEFICKKNNKENPGLRYQLSKQLEFTQREDALPYLHNLVVLGENVPMEVFSYAKLKKGCRYDCILAGIKFCRERKYSDALEWISSISGNEVDDNVEALKATLLNRTRNTKLAEEALKACLEKGGPPSRQNLIGAFLISNYIHAEELTKAQDVYKRLNNKYANTPMHGYLLRNAASAYKDNRDDLYRAAINAFKGDDDSFGHYTTLCNWGYSKSLDKKYDEAIKMLEESKVGLEAFPKTNMHIIYNNLGLCNLMIENFGAAYSYLSVAQKLGQNLMPKIFSTINLACVQAVSGDTASAINTLNMIEQDVEAHSLNRVKQKYYSNRLMVEYLSGNKVLSSLIERTEQHLDRYYPEHTIKTLQMYKNFSKSKKTPQRNLWRELYSPCGLAYWYMDPLKLFSEGVFY